VRFVCTAEINLCAPGLIETHSSPFPLCSCIHIATLDENERLRAELAGTKRELELLTVKVSTQQQDKAAAVSEDNGDDTNHEADAGVRASLRSEQPSDMNLLSLHSRLMQLCRQGIKHRPWEEGRRRRNTAGRPQSSRDSVILNPLHADA